MAVNWTWTSGQNAVISAAANARLLVDAGPGTGKTATACARVAWLIDSAAVEPSNIMLVSFTRAAVHELRLRIGSFLEDPSHAHAVKISTIDSLSAKVRAGAGSGASEMLSYAEGILAFSQLLDESEDVRDYLRGFQHLVVDEAQDIVTPRAEMLLDIIHVLPSESGVSVFADEAQAIYGFAELEAPSSPVSGSTLPDCIRAYMGEQFEESTLTEVHRTNDKALKKLFKIGRATVRGSDAPALQYDAIRELIVELRHKDLGTVWEALHDNIDNLDDAFVLFRTRGEALAACQTMDGENRRLRLPQLPTAVNPWIATLGWDFTKASLGRRAFEELAADRLPAWSDADATVAWQNLVRVAGESQTSVSMRRLTHRLAQSHPPYELCSPDVGIGGPLIGTIHAAKGREADVVCLYLPKPRENDIDGLAEEARVLFVGASRARIELRVHEGRKPSYFSKLNDSGRVFRKQVRNKQAFAQVEVGRTGDIDARGLTGMQFFGTSADAGIAQSWIAAVEDGVYEGICDRTYDEGRRQAWAYGVRFGDEDDPIACYLSEQLNYDLFQIQKRVKPGRPRSPKKLYFLRSLGARSLAVSPDDPARDELHSPWRESGLMLAPQIAALANAYF